MSEIAKLVSKPSRCNQTVVAMLEEVTKLVQAESLTGIAIAAVDVEGHSYFRWVSGENYSVLLGAIARLEKRVMNEAEEPR